ncbi:hypothetical protein K470DRAFT_77962 [Piedraia hortae CBS 480.64]|uniref:Uncharacterized protein n=1 Tax=Piedraia hortae CBS 480.64 TaxID=1314780 RepID=A0A6A7BYD5_9PEZI|nr:hypothetical protein K470DRAFT_77962 [Piedraia hortae CBS 480.64]
MEHSDNPPDQPTSTENRSVEHVRPSVESPDQGSASSTSGRILLQHHPASFLETVGGATQPAHGLQQHEYDGLQYAQSRFPQAQAQYPVYGPSMSYGSSQHYEHIPQWREGAGAAFTPSAYYIANHRNPVSASNLSAHSLAAQYQPGSLQPTDPSIAHYAFANAPVDHSHAVHYQYLDQYQLENQAVGRDFGEYQARIGTIFTLVKEGNLRDAKDLLLQISQYLLGNVEQFGLTNDDETLRDERIKLWDEFNSCWLSTMLRQYELVEKLALTGRRPQESQSMMTARELEQLSLELVHLCDAVERFGLVDYQMGVAEDEIMDLVIRILDLLEPAQQGSP